MLYRTFSLCPCCVLLDRAIGTLARSLSLSSRNQHNSLIDTTGTSMQWKNAAVVAQGGRVFLSVGCGKHGRQDTLYCSNESFFKRVGARSLEAGHQLNRLISTCALGVV